MSLKNIKQYAFDRSVYSKNEICDVLVLKNVYTYRQKSLLVQPWVSKIASRMNETEPKMNDSSIQKLLQ